MLDTYSKKMNLNVKGGYDMTLFDMISPSSSLFGNVIKLRYFHIKL